MINSKQDYYKCDHGLDEKLDVIVSSSLNKQIYLSSLMI